MNTNGKTAQDVAVQLFSDHENKRTLPFDVAFSRQDLLSAFHQTAISNGYKGTDAERKAREEFSHAREKWDRLRTV